MARVPTSSTAEPANALRASRATTVLLVDDDVTTRILVRRLLETTQRFRVVGEAGNGADGVALAGSLLPDVVVLDIEMPVMDGRQALPLMRQAIGDAKIVVFSGRVGDVSAPDVNALDADLFVTKGTDCSTIVPALLSITSEDNRRPPAGGNTLGKRAAS